MGFFLKHVKAKERKPPKGQAAASGSKTSKEMLTRLGCKACPLNNAPVTTPKMQPTLARETDVYFLAEAPGKDEDENTGRPLTGPSGKLLRSCIPDDMAKYCSYDNVVRDRPPQNRTPTWQEVECCRGHVTASIAAAKPKLIVGLGAIPMHWMLNSMDMSGMRGRVFAVNVGGHHCWFMPTYHPSFILRTAFKKDQPLRSKLGHCFKLDLRRAFELVEKLPPAKVDTPEEARSNVQCFNGSRLDVLLKLLAEAQRAPHKAVDIETYPLRPYAANSRLLTCAVSFAQINFSFALEHPKAKWTDEEKAKIKKALKALLMDDTIKIAHNVPFELEWFVSRLGADVVNHVAWECTMMQAHFVDERKGKKAKDSEERRAAYQSLDFLVKQYFGIAYKALFKLDKKKMADADLDETLIYNGVDTKYTLRLWKRQRAILIEQKILDAYEEALPRQATVALMQHLGIDVGQKAVLTAQAKLGGEIADLVGKIADLKVVQAFVKDRKEFNPLSTHDAIALFRDYLKRPEILVTLAHHEAHDFGRSSESKKKYDEKGAAPKYSVDKNVLDKIDHPLAKLIIDLRNRTKLKSTNVDTLELGVGNVIFPDNKIHTSFNTTFAETGRTSSDSPNMQNWPHRSDPWVRKMVVAPKGHVLVAFDYGQLEACTGAMCSKDKALITALWDDYDIHMEWAQKTAHKYPRIVGGKEYIADKKVMKKFRSLVKNKLVFPAIFGASDSSIAGYLNMPEDIIASLMDEFWESFSGLKRWQDKLMTGYYDSGWVESPTGRRHRYPLTRNEAINFPIQSVACDIVCDAMNRLSYKALEEEKWWLHPRLNIHDDLTFIIPDDDKVLEESITDIYRIMLTPPYSFINVPLSVTASIGNDWFEADAGEIGKFWSNKDL